MRKRLKRRPNKRAMARLEGAGLSIENLRKAKSALEERGMSQGEIATQMMGNLNMDIEWWSKGGAQVYVRQGGGAMKTCGITNEQILEARSKHGEAWIMCLCGRKLGGIYTHTDVADFACVCGVRHVGFRPAATKRDEVVARLGKGLNADGSLGDTGEAYVNWQPGLDRATLDGRFSAEELEDIAWWMRYWGGK